MGAQRRTGDARVHFAADERPQLRHLETVLAVVKSRVERIRTNKPSIRNSRQRGSLAFVQEADDRGFLLHPGLKFVPKFVWYTISENPNVSPEMCVWYSNY